MAHIAIAVHWSSQSFLFHFESSVIILHMFVGHCANSLVFMYSTWYELCPVPSRPRSYKEVDLSPPQSFFPLRHWTVKVGFCTNFMRFRWQYRGFLRYFVLCLTQNILKFHFHIFNLCLSVEAEKPYLPDFRVFRHSWLILSCQNPCVRFLCVACVSIVN